MKIWRRRRIQRPRVDIRLARSTDDDDLRRLLRDNAMPGMVPMAFEREPSYFHGATILGDQHETIVAHDQATKRLVGLGNFAVRRAWLNGTASRLGYLSQLRIEQGYRGLGSLLSRGFRLFRELHPQYEIDCYVTTIFASNRLGRIVLEKDRDWKPYYRRRGVLSTLALPLWRPRRVALPPAVTVQRGRVEQLPDIAACLQRNNRRFQFAPQWTADDLAHEELTRGLRAEDFFVACRGGRLVGCLALWDQQEFKQTVVHGYRRGLSLARHCLNRGSGLGGWPRLPAEGEALRHAYISHVAVDEDDGRLFRALLATAYNASTGGDRVYLTVGFDTRHPFYRVTKFGYPHIDYRSILYLAYWDDGTAAAAALDQRIPHVEISVM
jgi:hypothetical protein